MAIVSAAIAAVSLAIAAPAFATVATAAVAVGAVIGTAGLAVSVAGMITGNKDLKKAGKIMGYVGAGAGLAGGLIGGIGGLASGGGFFEGAAGAYTNYAQEVSKAWDSGIGSWFAGDAGTSGASGAAGVDTSMNYAPGVQDTATKPFTGEVGAIPYQDTGLSQTGTLNQPFTSPDLNASIQQSIASGGVQPPVAPSAPLADTSYAPQVVAANAGPKAPGAPSPAFQEMSKGVFNGSTTGAPGPNAGMPEWAKYAVATSTGQALSGLAAGYFQGLSAEEQIEFQKQVEANRQQQLGVTNARGAYAPLVSFNRGTLNRI